MDWKTMLNYISGSVDEESLLRNGYFVAENRVLRNQNQVVLQLPDPFPQQFIVHHQAGYGPIAVSSALRRRHRPYGSSTRSRLPRETPRANASTSRP